MRVKGASMPRLFVAIAATLAVVVASAVVGFELRDGGPDGVAARGAPRKAVPVVQDVARLPWIRSGTRRIVGQVRARGRTIRLETAESTDGEECLLDTDLGTGSTGATCSKGGLFEARNVAFSVNFDGGPERFDALSVVGLAAPGIASVALAKSDGSVTRVDLDRTRAFAVESSALELERGVVPTGLVLFGPNRKPVQEVDIPVTR
jgi:hypothetical protein